MSFKPIFGAAILAIAAMSAACPAGDESGSNSNSEASNSAPAGNSEANDPFNEITATPAPAEKVEAATLRPVVSAYCDAMRAKNEAGLRKVYSRATIRSFEEDMRADGVTSLVEFLSSEPVGEKCEVVNERIQGDVGEALVSTQTYPNGVMIKFVKEGGEWKMTNQSSDFDSVRKSGKQ